MAFCPALLELAVASQALPKFFTITSSNLHNTWPVQTRSLWTWSKLSFKQLCYSLLSLGQSSISRSWLKPSRPRSTRVPLFFLWAPPSRRDPHNKRITGSRNTKRQWVIWAKPQPNRLLRVPSSFLSIFVLWFSCCCFLVSSFSLSIQMEKKQVYLMYFLHIHSVLISYISFRYIQSSMNILRKEEVLRKRIKAKMCVMKGAGTQLAGELWGLSCPLVLPLLFISATLGAAGRSSGSHIQVLD